MTAYYNEIDPYVAQWLRNLIKGGHIAPGDVDERSIEDIKPDDLRKYKQCHFFAGVGVWSHSLRAAGWDDEKRVWTGSCPCQPFSAAGKGNGFSDERHLWPAWFHLISQCEPSIIFGEQVASKDADPWIDLVHTDLEALDYSFGAIPFPSAGVGAPHIRDRLYWVADAKLQQRQASASDSDVPRGREQEPATVTGLCSNSGAGPTNGHWSNADWLGCRDGKWRPVEPGASPLVNGAAARVGRLRAYGNAINAQAAKAFIESYLGG